ncbi:hypothetical protein [Variovorax sp. CY25R-8]|uniref:hypothetical protein n=1 Tax=Variovorax sp. CY25R-8 TaxID=2855501 RepID=UPI0021BB0D25|nr:hypothetical protein [Variovorax sp. CY25R-8]
MSAARRTPPTLTHRERGLVDALGRARSLLATVEGQYTGEFQQRIRDVVELSRLLLSEATGAFDGEARAVRHTPGGQCDECEGFCLVRTAQHTTAPLADRERAILGALKVIKSNLLHQRRFGSESLGAWRMSATNAEADIEEVIARAAGSGA